MTTQLPLYYVWHKVMPFDKEKFYSRLTKTPALLFLGQKYLALESGEDPFLTQILRRYTHSEIKQQGYFGIFESDIATIGDTALAWMDDRCKKLDTPEWLATLTEFAWSGVYTSSIDSHLLSSFRKPWRDVQLIIEEKFSPSDPRNRTNLHCTQLFGSVNQSDENTRAPLMKFEWSKRKQIAIALLRRLPELVTPLGHLLFEGYDPSTDWLPLEELLPVIDDFGPQQVHVFSANSPGWQSPDIQYLISREKITLHTESLVSVLTSGLTQGFIEFGAPNTEDHGTTQIFIKSKTVGVPLDIWNQTNRSASIIDSTLISQPRPLSEDANYREFRTFLSGLQGRSLFTGILRGFNFTRDFERTLRDKIVRRISRSNFSSDPLILHGQTGTGKSLALASVATSIAQERNYPVLYIERRTQKPIYSDIERFCEWAEDKQAQTVLMIWDGMLQPEEYSDLLRVLTGRGRKIILVGSCYRLEKNHAAKLGAVEAPAILAKEEQERFTTFLSSFHPSLSNLVPDTNTYKDGTFLVTLYRMLPPTRSVIRSGLTMEVGYAQEQLAEKAALVDVTYKDQTILETKLRAAGFTRNESLFSKEERHVAGEPIADVQEFTGLIMVPGQFGLRVPLELLLRTLGKRDTLKIVRLFEGIDIFKWQEDGSGNIDIGPRNALEAQLLVRVKMGGPKVEVEYIKRLLFEIKDGIEYGADSREVSFIVDLLRAVGPQGERQTYYSPYFRELSDTLQRLRSERNIQNPRVMLLEGHLRREWAISKSREDQSDPLIDISLEEAEVVLTKAIELHSGNNKGRTLRNSLFTELTTTLATRARRKASNKITAKKYYEDAKSALRQARRQDPDSYYPVDILGWFARDIIKTNVLESTEKSELLADVLSSFQTAESMELDTEQEIRFRSRQLEISSLVDWKSLEHEAFEKLDTLGSTAGYYMRALQMSGLAQPSTTNLSTSQNIEQCEKSFAYLQDNYERIKNDPRCLELFFDLWWIKNTGTRQFAEERTALPFTQKLWSDCLNILNAIESTGESQRPLAISYLKGICLFHLGGYEASIQLFKELDRESDRMMGRRRILKSYIASTAEGTPQKFHGTVSWVNFERNKGAVHVEQLRRLIDFRPQDFGRTDIQQYASLGEFHIAFNFVGLIAESASFHKG